LLSGREDDHENARRGKRGRIAGGRCGACAHEHIGTNKSWLNQAGVTDIEFVRFQPVLLNPAPNASFTAAKSAAETLTATH